MIKLIIKPLKLFLQCKNANLLTITVVKTMSVDLKTIKPTLVPNVLIMKFKGANNDVLVQKYVGFGARSFTSLPKIPRLR
jgi:hypothetical protein